MTADILAPKDHYVYAHYKATSGEIFYIGKGSDKKRFKSRGGRNDWWKSVVQKHGFRVEIIQDGLQEWAALELECELISLYGRADLGLGTLVNLTDGGEGVSGNRPSDETLRKRSASLREVKNTVKGKITSSAARKLFWGTTENRCALLKRLAEISASEEVKAKRKSTFAKNGSGKRISESSKRTWERPGFKEAHQERTRQPVLCVETGVVYPSTVHAYQATGVHHTNISRVARNVPRYKTAGGFHWEYVSTP